MHGRERRPRDIHRGKDPLVLQQAMRPTCIGELSHDSASVINPKGFRREGTRDRNRRELALVAEKKSSPSGQSAIRERSSAGSTKPADDLPRVIDPEKLRM